MNTYDEENKPINGDQAIPVVDPSLDGKRRINFIRKVYSILSIQLLFTTFFTAIAYMNPGFQTFLVVYYPLCYLWLITIIIIEIVLICCRSCARTTPNNYILLGVFTFGFAWVVATICSAYFIVLSNGGFIVMLALAMTCGMTLALTLYACTTKDDFTICGLFILITSVCLFFFMIILLITNSPIVHAVICVITIMIYSVYLLIDTQLIMGGKRYELSMDDYIIGAMILYIDIIILFLELLKLLAILFGKN